MHLISPFHRDDHFHPAHGHRPDLVRDKLYVITPIFNPQRFKSRWKLYKDFERMVLDHDEAYLVTIECSFGQRDEVFTTQVSDRHMVIHVRTHHEIWIKENLINLAIQRLPSDWKYVAWIDSDVKFARPDWVGETLHQLQHYHVIQMFSEALDLGPDYQILTKHNSFMWCYMHNKETDKTYSRWHPGFAWAARREYIDIVGCLMEHSILGAGDRNMATSLIGRLQDSIPTGLHPGYLFKLRQWQDRAKLIKKNVGYMEGLLLHYWHGAKKHRKYKERWQILLEGKFDPEFDLKKDWQGLFQLTDRNIKLRDDIRRYFRERNEDGIDL